MKEGEEALAQYRELANALRQIGLGWAVTEVEDILSRGKEVPFRDLSTEQQTLYEVRLDEEVSKGFRVGRLKPSDRIGVPYQPAERLAMLVGATKTVIDTSVRSRDYVSRFASRHDINSVILEQPVGADISAGIPERREVRIAAASNDEERLNALASFLNANVLE